MPQAHELPPFTVVVELQEHQRQIAQLTAREAELAVEVERLKALNRGMYEAFAKGFTTCQSHGPSRKYEMVTKFNSLADMQAADKAWIDTCLAGWEDTARNALGEG